MEFWGLSLCGVKIVLRNFVVLMLCVTVIAPIALYTDRIGTFKSHSSEEEFIEDVSSIAFNGDSGRPNLLSQGTSNARKELIGIVYPDKSSETQKSSLDLGAFDSRKQHFSGRVLSATNEHEQNERVNLIKQVIDGEEQDNHGFTSDKADETVENGNGEDAIDVDDKDGTIRKSDHLSNKGDSKKEDQGTDTTNKVNKKEPCKHKSQKRNAQTAPPDARVRQLKDQLIRARVYLSLPAIRNNHEITRELRQRMREVQRALGDASKDADLPRNTNEKSRAMEQTLIRGKQIQDDCSASVKKLRAMLHSTEEQLRVYSKQSMFLTQLTAKTLPKGLHCLPLRLTIEYYSLNSSEQQFPNQDKLEDPQLFHYAIFSDNVLAAAVVVNSTVANAKHPSKHVFHIVTDRLNYAAMRMWFLIYPPVKGTIQVQNIEEFTWLNSSYSPVLKQLGSQSMIDYYFRAHQATPDPNLKFRNPKYLSILNHLRFYLPEVFPKLNKVLFLDDDIVVQKDITGLWSLDLKGNVNGAVETCGESFHRFDRYLNFSNPLISNNFDPHACGWAYGMNIFDLTEWRRQNITEVYHNWQRLNHDRQLWKLGTLPPGLITFYNRTFPVNKWWHVLGLGYNPNVPEKDIELAGVIHYNGNLKPWLEISIPKYRVYWSKYVDFDHKYLRECNINP